MWVKCGNLATRRLKLPWMDEPVEFDAGGRARVAKSLAERLVREVDGVEIEPEVDAATVKSATTKPSPRRRILEVRKEKDGDN